MEIPLTINETQKGLLAKKFSAVELVDAYLERIKRYNNEYHIYLTLSDLVAYDQARRVDKILRDKDTKILRDYPLLGVSFAFKDLFSTEGIRTTAGSRIIGDYIPPYSCTFVERVLTAGGICVGKTNEDAWGHGSSGENTDYKPTKNPWQKDYVPGGSSSGSGAALAANMALIASGTDTGSSVRMPASFCNLVGLKPTYGAVSRYGVVAMASSLDTIGHLARTTEDIEKVFAVVKGPDGKDSTVKEAAWVKPRAKMKLGLPKEYFVKGIDREVEAMVSQAAKVFKKEGIELVEVSLPLAKYAISVYYIIMPAEVSSNLSRYDGVRYGDKRQTFGPEAKRRIILGTYVLSAGYYEAYYLRAQKVRSKLIENFDQVFRQVDALITPVCPTPPFKLGERVDDPLQMYLADIFTVSANLAGIPGLAIPYGFSQKGLPLGFQLMGPRFAEPVLFELGKIYEKATDYKPRVAF